MAIDINATAQELITAFDTHTALDAPLSSRPGFDLATAYRVGDVLTAHRRAQGHRTVGRKVAFGNHAIWKKFNLETVAWGPMYDDTVMSEAAAQGKVPVVFAPKVEPEIVFKLKAPLPATVGSAEDALRYVEWYSLGYEIVDCPCPGWQFQPADLVAAFGFHIGLVLGAPTPVDQTRLEELSNNLATFRLRLYKDDVFVEEGGGKAVLENPALCLAEFGRAVGRSPWAEPLAAGEVITTGSLTTPTLIHRGETWRAEAVGLAVAPMSVRI
jgi:2-oxo-3-hexenedioate decarboxylase